MSRSRRARQPPHRNVAAPRATRAPCHTGSSAKAGESRATRKIPAFTIAAACRNALTGVGAAIAPGNQKLNGTIADFDSAPTSSRVAATDAVVPVGGAARRSPASKLPTDAPSTRMPPSIASPPKVVTMRAVMAACRFARRSGLWPISRNDRTVVASQNT